MSIKLKSFIVYLPNCQKSEIEIDELIENQEIETVESWDFFYDEDSNINAVKIYLYWMTETYSHAEVNQIIEKFTNHINED